MTTIPMLIKFQQYIVVCLFHFTVSKATTVYLYLQSTVRPIDLPKRADSKDYKQVLFNIYLFLQFEPRHLKYGKGFDNDNKLVYDGCGVL